MMSFCLSVGSPAMITYSLTLTILNRYWVRERFHKLSVKAQSRTVHDRYAEYSNRVRAIQYLLQEAQQVPLRASQEKGWLSSLLVAPKNQAWWRNVQRRLRRTRRGVAFSLVAQILAAAIAWLFTVSSSFVTSTGDIVVANQLSSGSLWMWLIPIIWGWVTVGTQASADSINEALRAGDAYRAKEPPVSDEGPFTEKGEQLGIVVRTGLALQPHRAATNEAAFEAPPVTNLELPSWCGADVIGDERLEGPIFNYARVFTWWQLARTIESATATTLAALADGRTCKPGVDKPDGSLWNSNKRPEENLAGDSYTTARYCGLDLGRAPIMAYPEWSEIAAEVWKRIFVAAVFAIFVQWGTTGPGILIAYYTPTRGIGCRSGGYALYGGLGAAVWILLTASMLFSHAALLRYQRQQREAPSMDFRKNTTGSRSLQGYVRTWGHSALCGTAVLTPVLGKLVAVLNACWLVLSSLLEYTGVYDRCYCEGNQLGLGEKGWVVLFKTDAELAQFATTLRAGGVAMSIIVCLITYFFFCLGSRKGYLSGA
ncbi:hypothetical protein AOQ84DRAFT_398719 [Glonium stellatum]|uniref:Uncharacterized protein n=1 Tax=Glonium stellatum TaxID=574774 RepID=A0A8E2EY09_9PEZI|nr:hypothetical protein AOQ84DRAFT_398719 [Glonium stellatum]